MKQAVLGTVAVVFLAASAAPQIRIAPGELRGAAKGVPYSASIRTNIESPCIMADISLSVSSGTLPRGLEVTTSGLDGVPREMGDFRFTIRAANGCAAADREFELRVSGKPILEASPSVITFSCPTPEQPPAPKTILLSSTWTDLPYTVETLDANWLRVRQAHGVTPDPDSAMTGDVVTLTVDSSKLKPGTYRGSVLFWTQDGANAPEVPVVLVIGAQERH